VSIIPGALYVVATPIGNLGDFSARAIEVLGQVARIAAEDTRHSVPLLHRHGIATPLLSLHEHNERERVAQLIAELQGGAAIGLISDAGTPLISDPGFHLVRAARAQGIRVIPVPGACAVIAALSAAGLPTDRFVFEGFLPAKSAARRARLEALRGETRTLAFYESSHRIIETLSDMVSVIGAQRPAVLARELTKTFETIRDGRLDELLEFVSNDANQQKGEFVLLVQGAEDVPEDAAEAGRVLGILLEALPVKQAAALAERITGVKKNELYKLALTLKDSM
jgi:16S rRNA (cytidine1402-2'-O)-methyltransferase